MSGRAAGRLRWPERLWIVRHGQSAGNVAREAALAGDLTHIALNTRDMDVPLSALGRDQARALGHWLAALPQGEEPETALVSPYRRAVETAELVREAGGLPAGEPFCLDERLREKEFGIVDGLTARGIAELMPDQAQFREVLGKFYHRPPGGESWCDVILRLRSLLDTVALHHEGQRVLIVAHQVVVLCLRYILEKMDEPQILAIDAEQQLANCAITEYRFDSDTGGPGGGPALVRYNFVAPIAQETRVTRDKDEKAGPGG